MRTHRGEAAHLQQLQHALDHGVKHQLLAADVLQEHILLRAAAACDFQVGPDLQLTALCNVRLAHA